MASQPKNRMPRRRRQQRVAYPRDQRTADQVAVVAEEVAARLDLPAKARRWAPYTPGPADLTDLSPLQLSQSVPTLALDDYSELPFIREIVGLSWYQYRARLRCGEGDCYAVTAPEIPGYETYSRDFLGLGRSRPLHVLPGSRHDLRLARTLMRETAAFTELRRLVESAGRLLIHPYMGIEAVWELAAALAAATGLDVRVLAPPPHVTRLANNKAEFSSIVEQMVGPEAIARTATSAVPADLAELLRDQVGRCEYVALKMPSCASGMGNRVFLSADLRTKSLAALRGLVERFLDEKEWDGRESVLVVEWHRDVIQSPSAQCWIPPLGAGEPIVEEVYEQFLLHDVKVFEGAMLSGLPRRLRHELMVMSWLVCGVFQRLGYIGRCSFDGLVVGRSLADARVKLVECNGRWGGTSTPMHLMKRVFGDFRRFPYKAQDYVDSRLEGLEFPQLLELFDGHLYDGRTGKGRVLLYNVGGITDHGKFDLVVTGRTFAEVDRFIRARVPALVERYVGTRVGARVGHT